MDHGCTNCYGPGTTRSHVRVVQEAGAVPEGGETNDQLGEDGPRERTDLDEHDTGAGTVPAPIPLRAGRREPGVAEDLEGEWPRATVAPRVSLQAAEEEQEWPAESPPWRAKNVWARERSASEHTAV